MKLLIAASEAVPYCKTGGLADVAGALPDALHQKGHTVRLVLPLYRGIRERFHKVRPTGKVVFVPAGTEHERVEVWEEEPRPGFHVYFVRADAYFDRPGLYGDTPGSAYGDNDRRYALFSRAVFEVARAMNFHPDVIHAHDWQAGLVPAYQRHFYRFDHFFKTTATVFTIHNIAYQGNFPPSSLATAGLPGTAFQPSGVEFYGQVSYIKAGLVYSNALNTVSPTYAREIMTDPAISCALDGVLRSRADRFRGITNGIDVHFWDPERDKHLAAHYSSADLTGRAMCKADLQARCGFSKNKARPLLAFIGRLDHQKGVDHLIEIAPALLAKGVEFVFLGQGQEHYVRALYAIRERFPSQVFVETKFAEPLAHKIYAGADLFLMPSRFEPCGLGQLIAMRYGAIPIVTPTGGLLDTVRSAALKNGTGVVSADQTPGAYHSAVLEGLSLLKDAKKRAGLQRRAMSEDRSWDRSVDEYVGLYTAATRWASERV
ncbi:MAG: glycogen synthase GlgA [Elusimicrobia bacterium]|nr:glycogen synthase GlgA [Elusimicrobiota bacterium]